MTLKTVAGLVSVAACLVAGCGRAEPTTRTLAFVTNNTTAF